MLSDLSESRTERKIADFIVSLLASENIYSPHLYQRHSSQ